ncbi:unnamed protein product [Hapterophycus canaliculatus]
MYFCFLSTAVFIMLLVSALPALSTNEVDLSELAGSISAVRAQARIISGGRNSPQQDNRFSLRHLEAMWHTSLGTQLDQSSSGREEAFRATLDFQWRLLALEDNVDRSFPDTTKEGPKGASRQPTRSPFLVCGNRHPDMILALESVIHRARIQLAYSRGDTACLLAGLRLDDVEAVRQLEGVQVVEPVPQPAKLSRSLHAKLGEPSESLASSAANGDGGSPSNKINSEEGATVGGVAGTPQRSRRDQNNEKPRRHSGHHEQQHASSPRAVVFNHGEGLPSDLDVSLTPGTWGKDIADTWKKRLANFESTERLWDEHLRERFLWTRPSVVNEHEVVVGTMAKSGAGSGEGESRRSLRDEALTSKGSVHRRRNALVEAHGLEGVESLWDQTTELSSKDGACDFQRLRASSASEHNSPNSDPRRSAKQGSGLRTRRQRRDGGFGERRPEGPAADKENGGATHDRVVLRGAGSLGATPQDNAHCLLTVLAYLVTLPEVAYVDDLPQVYELNVEAAWITQSGEETTYSIWEQGIDGRTEIITMADSGLDINSCFFSEDDTDDNIECSTYSNPVYDLTKRKARLVVQYVGYVDCGDTENGHGTHVGGSAVGALSKTSPGEHFGDGSGFGAKLAVFDFGNDEGGLVTPSNIQARTRRRRNSAATQMLQPPYDIGARISTNSWGALRTTYTTLDRQMDYFAYFNPDMVIVVAGGNCGDVISGCVYQGENIYGAGSMLSPAIAKNVITVGASEASPSTAGLADNIDEVCV